MKRYQFLVVLAAVALMSAGIVVGRRGGDAQAAICDTSVPVGAIAPAVPEWCKLPLAAGGTTFSQGANSWLDEFNHGLTHADIGAGYRTWNIGTMDSLFWRHNNHWMVDVQTPGQVGGGYLRPDRTFTGVSGKLVVEGDAAAGISTYGNLGAWPEFIVTTAPAPGAARTDAIYGYDFFANSWTFGCRTQADQAVICSLMDASPNGATRGGRIFEISWFQCAGTVCRSNLGAMRTCNGTDPDINCRDRFRIELTANSVAVYINGNEALFQSGLPGGLSNLVGGQPAYVYYASNTSQLISSSLLAQKTQTVRFHWDRLAVNPGSGPSAPPPPSPPTATPTNTPITTAPPPTSTPVPAAPTNTPVVTQPTSTPVVAPPTSTPTPVPPVTSSGGSCRIQVRQANGTWKTLSTGTLVNGVCVAQ